MQAARRGEATVRCKGKIRTVMIPGQLRKKLLRYAARRRIVSGSVFLGAAGTPICRGSVWRQMKRLCTVARVLPEKVFPHNLRHLFARTFYQSEKDIVKLADILGHSSINTTRIYVVSTGTEHRRCPESMRLIL